jgi:hypothetical protein
MQVKPRVGGSVGCGRGPSAFFEGSTDAAEAPSCASSSSARRRCGLEAHRAQPPRTSAARSRRLSQCEKACAFPPQPGEGKVHPIAHQVKPAAGCGAAPEAMGFLKKFLMALCRASIRVPFPTPSGKLRAPRHGRRAGHGVARGELSPVPVMRGVRPIHDEPKEWPHTGSTGSTVSRAVAAVIRQEAGPAEAGAQDRTRRRTPAGSAPLTR